MVGNDYTWSYLASARSKDWRPARSNTLLGMQANKAK